MSTTTMETRADDESQVSNTCTIYGGFGGFRRNQVFDDYSLVSNSEMVGEEDWDWDSDSDSDSDSLFGIKDQKEGLETIREDCESSVFSLDIRNWKDIVYVCVGKHGDHSSMGALSWTLKHWIRPSTILCLLHVFPVVRLIPSPMGKLPRTHVNIAYVNAHLDQEKGKRKVLLQKFIDLCVASQVKVETMLIEGDNVVKAILDLVKNLGIGKLVIGITKSNLSKTGSSRRKGIADKVVKNAPENCDVKIICEEKDVICQIIGDSSPRYSDSGTSRYSREENESRGFAPFRKLFRPRPFSPR